MPWRADMNRRPDGERGSTLAEALVALALASVVFGACMPLVRSAAKALDRALRLAEEDRSIAAADELLRRSVSRVRFPSRARTVAVGSIPDGVELGFLDGDPSRTLDLFHRHGQLVANDGVSVERVPGIPFASFSFHFRQSGGERSPPVPVVSVRIECDGGESATIYAAVGTWPLLPPQP